MSFAHPIRSQARNLGRILRSASFRLPLIYAVLFVLSAGALFVTVYWTATAAMQTDMAAVLRTEISQYYSPGWEDKATAREMVDEWSKRLVKAIDQAHGR